MRFEVRTAGGAPREVELQGTQAVAGRDPFCDLVLNDPKCSRRHAVFEAGPNGMLVRDSGSANGVYVNGRRVQQAGLKEGDVVRLGESVLKVLPEDVPRTLVMSESEVQDAIGAAAAASPPPASPSADPREAAASRRPPAAPRPRPAAVAAAGPPERAMPITMLSVLWLCAAAALAVTTVAVAVSAPADALTRAAGSITAIALAGVAAALGVGLWVRAPWARPLQLATAGVGLLVCPFSLAAASILLYMTRPSARAQFEPAAHGAPDRATAQADVAFTAAILGTTLLGVAVGIVALMVPRLLLARSSAPRLSSRETTVLRRMQAVGAAESAFRTGTCEGYADLDALVHPEVVIPNYPAQGPAFLAAELAAPEAVGYRFHLGVEGPLPPAEGCPSRSYRGYTLTATPVTGAGHHFLMRSDRIVRAAEGRPATLADPPLQ